MPLEAVSTAGPEIAKSQIIDVEANRAKRLERVKAKYRDRGGIFKPKENNELINILLAKDVSGLSPSKRAKRKSSAAAPRKSSGRKVQPVTSEAGPSAPSKKNVNKVPAAPAEIDDVETAKSGHNRKNAKNARRQKNVAPPTEPPSPNSKKSTSKASRKAEFTDKPGPSSSSIRKTNSASETTKCTIFPLVNLSGASEPPVPVPAPAVSGQRSFSRKRTLPIPDSDGATTHDTGTTAPLRSSPRKRTKIDISSSEKEPSNSTAHRNPPTKGKRKGKEVASIEDETPNGARKPAHKNSSTSIRSNTKGSPAGYNDDTDETAVESDGARQTRGGGRKTARKGKGNAGKGSRSQKKPDYDQDPDAGTSKNRSHFPAPNLETVFEEENDQADLTATVGKKNAKGRKRLQVEEAIMGDKEDLPSSSRKRGKTSGEDKQRSKPEFENAEPSIKPAPKSRAKIMGPSEGPEYGGDKSAGRQERPEKTESSGSYNDKHGNHASKGKENKMKATRSTKSNNSKSKPNFPKAAYKKSTFANQPTLLFSSPVKPQDTDPDEIDFLS